MAKNLVFKATTDDLEAPSGFVLKELAQLTKVSVTECQVVEQTLLARLKKNSPNIKFKCLKTIKYLASNGRADLARSFQRSHDAIRDCINFTGKPHPLHGEELNQRVRDAAKEALAAVFSGPVEGAPSLDYEARTKIKGFEGGAPLPPAPSSGFMSGVSLPSLPTFGLGASTSSTPSYSSSKMPSLSNPHYVPEKSSAPGIVSSMMDKVKETVGSIPMPSFGKSKMEYSEYPSAGPYVPPTIDFSGTGTGYSSAPSSGPTPSYSAEIRMETRGPMRPGDEALAASKVRRKKGQVGGMWAADEDDESVKPISSSRSSGTGSSWADQSRAGPTATPDSGFGTGLRTAVPVLSGVSRPVTKAKPSAIEVGLINDLTSAAGVKTVPPKDKLGQLTSAYGSLDHQNILELLDEKLDEGEKWQTHKKALLVVEALYQIDSDFVSNYFQDSPDNLVVLLNSSQQSVSQKAAKLLKLFNVEFDAMSPNPSSASAPTPTVEDGEDGSEEPSAFPSAPLSAPSTSSQFSFMAAGSSAAPVDMFSKMTISTPASSAPSTAPLLQADDLLFLGTGGTSKLAGAHTVSSSDSTLDFLTSGTPAPELSAVPPSAAILAAMKKAPEPSHQPGAFSFMSDSTSVAPSVSAHSGTGMGIGSMASSGAPFPTTAPSGYPSHGGVTTAFVPGLGMVQVLSTPSGFVPVSVMPTVGGPSAFTAMPTGGTPGFGMPASVPGSDPFAFVKTSPAMPPTSSKKPAQDSFSFVQDMMKTS